MSTKLGTILADFNTALSTDIAVGGTTATLASATDDDGVALPSGRYFFTLDGSNSSKEHISCDLVGTALTNIKSLSRQGVETTGVVRKHRIGTSVSLTDFGHIKFINDLVSGTTQLNASAPLGYDGAPSSLAGNQLATVTYVLGVVNGGTVTFDKQIIAGQVAGEALTANDIVYFKESDAKWWKVDADLTATFDQLQMGVAQSTVSSNATVAIGISGPMSGFTGLTAGSKYYASNTPGQISATPGTVSFSVGYALNSTQLLFTVDFLLPSIEEKQAMAGGGELGTPSTSNKFATETLLGTRNAVEFTSSGTWTKPAGIKAVMVELIGAGGGGAGGGNSISGGAIRGNGGGGGAYFRKIIPASVLSSTETITIGVGGAGGAGAAPGSGNTNGGDGTNGGSTSFGTIMTVYGGGGALISNNGGGGGGTMSSGNGGSSPNGGSGGVSGIGGNSDVNVPGGSGENGGGGGGGAASGAGNILSREGGSSIYGGGGGGTGGKQSDNSGESGGKTGIYSAGGGGAGGVAPGGAGTSGGYLQGGGGGGGGGNTSGTRGGNGGAGGVGGGGGGGGASPTQNLGGGNGGNGGNGFARITPIY